MTWRLFRMCDGFFDHLSEPEYPTLKEALDEIEASKDLNYYLTQVEIAQSDLEDATKALEAAKHDLLVYQLGIGEGE